jgi:lipoprotein NlpD
MYAPARRLITDKLRWIMVMMVVVLLAGCAGTGIFAPVSNISDLGVGGTYRIQPGDTLTSISRETGVSVDRLASLNNITNPSLIKVGQRLRLNSDTPEQASANDSGSVMVSSMAASRQGDVDPSPRAPESVTRANDATTLDLVWPAKGKIIQKFTVQTKGIDIAGSVGEPVVAAAAGKVAYSGNGARGFGNLVILDHGNGFITAYAHNEKLLVKSGDDVKKSAQVATMGQSDTSSPRLHFEVRRNGTPVDPMRYLPDQQ